MRWWVVGNHDYGPRIFSFLEWDADVVRSDVFSFLLLPLSR